MSRDGVLVLGAGGFIGRHLATRFAESGAPVLAATRRPAAFAHPGVRNVVAAYDDAAQFAELLAGCRLVVHAASRSTPGSSAATPQLDGNLRTTLALLEALQAAPWCRLLFLSSGGTLYGERDTPARETDPLLPRSYHGAGKAAAEHFIHAWAMQYGGTALVLRPSNVYGPGQTARSGFAIVPNAMECARDATPLHVWGDGSQVRDYLFVDDLIALCLRAAGEALDPGCHVYNAGSGEPLALNALLARIETATGQRIARVHQPARAVDITRVAVDAAAARARFGWTPRTDLDRGLAETWQWLRHQP